VVIVGPCAAGKTTLVSRLQALGYDAHACAQEHSGVPYLWQLSEPDLLLFLDADRATIGARRGYEWPAALNDAQQARLAHARAHADLYLDSGPLSPAEVAERAAHFIAGQSTGAAE
jgi:predicted ATPase